MSKIIAFAGLAGAGKDTATKFCIDHGYKRLAFGDVLKDVVSSLFSVSRELLEGDTPDSREWREDMNWFWTEKLEGIDGRDITPRIMLQIVGEHMRQWYPYIWADALERRLQNAIGHHENVAISDLRHISELRMLRDYGATTVGMYRHIPPWVKGFYTHMKREMPAGAADLLKRSRSDDKELLDYAARCEALTYKGKRIHTSEWQHLLMPFDHVLTNRGTIESLHKKLEPLL